MATEILFAFWHLSNTSIPLFVELAADFLEIRFGRPVGGTILRGAHNPPYFKRGESKKRGPVAC